MKWFQSISNSVLNHRQGDALRLELAALIGALPKESITLDIVWDAFWNKPLFSNIKVSTGQKLCRGLSVKPLDYHRVGDGSYSIVPSGLRCVWRSKAYWLPVGTKMKAYLKGENYDDIACKVTEARIAGIISFAELLNNAEHDVRIKYCFNSLTSRDMFIGSSGWQHAVTSITDLLCPGWSTTTILHGLTDMGLSIKPDIHFARAAIWSGFIEGASAEMSEKDISRWLSRDKNKFALVAWGVSIAREISNGADFAATLRTVDYIIMNASLLGIIKRGGSVPRQKHEASIDFTRLVDCC